MRKVFLAILTISILGSCSSHKLARKKHLIEVDIDLNNVLNDKVQVEVNPQKIKEETIIYQIPAFVPGTYVISDYGKFISDFKAYDCERTYLFFFFEIITLSYYFWFAFFKQHYTNLIQKICQTHKIRTYFSKTELFFLTC